MILKWRWRPQADSSFSNEKLRGPSLTLGLQRTTGTWPARPRLHSAGAGQTSWPRKQQLYWSDFAQDPWPKWERFLSKGLCYGCGGDWDFKGALKVDVESSEYTGYKYYFNKPGLRRKARSCEDARFLHINFRLLAELRCFEKVSFF